MRKEEQTERTQVRVRRAKPKASPSQEISYQNQNFLLLRKRVGKGSKIFPLQGELGDLTDAWGEPGCYRDENMTFFLIFCTLRLKQGF